MDMNVENGNDYVLRCIKDFFKSRKKNSENTHEAYWNDIAALIKEKFGHDDLYSLTKKDIESLTADVLEEYFDNLYELEDETGKKVYANGSLNRFQASIKSFIKYLAGKGAIDYNVAALKYIEKLNDSYEVTEAIPLEVALQYADYARVFEKRGVEKALLIRLALDTALRAEELLKLEWRQFTVEEDGVALRSMGSNRGKGNKEYTDKISHEFYKELLELKALGNTKKLFTLKYRTVADMMKKLNEIFGNSDRNYRFHSFKHTAVIMVYLQTGCILAAQKKARHANINTTRRYLNLVDQEVTGVISTMMNADDDLYKTVDHSLLIKCLDKCRYDVKLLLNKIIKEQMQNVIVVQK